MSSPYHIRGILHKRMSRKHERLLLFLVILIICFIVATEVSVTLRREFDARDIFVSKASDAANAASQAVNMAETKVRGAASLVSDAQETISDSVVSLKQTRTKLEVVSETSAKASANVSRVQAKLSNAKSQVFDAPETEAKEEAKKQLEETSSAAEDVMKHTSASSDAISNSAWSIYSASSYIEDAQKESDWLIISNVNIHSTLSKAQDSAKRSKQQADIAAEARTSEQAERAFGAATEYSQTAQDDARKIGILVDELIVSSDKSTELANSSTALLDSANHQFSVVKYSSEQALKAVKDTNTAYRATLDAVEAAEKEAEEKAKAEAEAKAKAEAEAKAKAAAEAEAAKRAQSISGSGVLTRSGGVNYYNGHRETWYSERTLPGGGLHIPGRYTDSSGLVRDGDGYLCLASVDYPKGTIIETSLGVGKVYDSGCPSGTIDIYTNW